MAFNLINYILKKSGGLHYPCMTRKAIRQDVMVPPQGSSGQTTQTMVTPPTPSRGVGGFTLNRIILIFKSVPLNIF